MRDLLYLRRYLRRYGKMMVLAFAVMMAAGALGPLAMSKTKEVFDSLFPGTGVVAPLPGDDGKPTPTEAPRSRS